MSIGEGASGYQVLEGICSSFGTSVGTLTNGELELGSGSFGTVFKGICRTTGDIVAIKLVCSPLHVSFAEAEHDGRSILNPAKMIFRRSNKRSLYSAHAPVLSLHNTEQVSCADISYGL